MTSEQISNLLQKQRTFYKSGATIPVGFRIEQLKKLYATVKKYETEVNDALKVDLGKSHYEGFMWAPITARPDLTRFPITSPL